MAGIDPLIFKRAADVTRQAIISTRTAQTDFMEAKANIIAERIVNGSPAALEEAHDDNEIDSFIFTPPSADESGLITKDFKLDESQVAAIDMLVQEQYGCLIGAAGSGKTTSQRFFLHKMIYGDEEAGIQPMTLRKLSGKQGLNIALVAFTGQATQVIKENMPSWMHICCKTIHSLLEYAPVTTEVVKEDGELKESTVFMPMRHAANKLDHEVILIDESSMVGLDLWHNLMDACKPGTKVFLVGDLNQLPPTASQSIFAYALAAWPVAELTHIHRQKEAAANKIIEVAHSILNGVDFEFDDPATNANWRVIGYEIDHLPQKAGVQIVSIANQLRNMRVHSSVDPDKPLIYDPYKDRIITAGNGYDENDARAAVQQSVINEALSQLIEPPTDENPRYIIDAGRSRKKFEVGHRVMATKNEPHDVVDRVTNGMTGRIVAIEKNKQWSGNHSLVGPEKEVEAARRKQVEAFFHSMDMDSKNDEHSELEKQMAEHASISTDGLSNLVADRDGGGPASHKVHVEFMNGASRIFSNKAGVDSLMLAYASTCHKCQGSQFDTAIIVVHHAWKGQLSREWLYTAVTRAQKRVVLLYTKYGIRVCLAKQRIFGRTLAEKIKKYQELNEEGFGPLKTKVRLYIEEA